MNAATALRESVKPIFGAPKRSYRAIDVSPMTNRQQVNRVSLYIKRVDDPVISDARAETSRAFQAVMKIA